MIQHPPENPDELLPVKPTGFVCAKHRARRHRVQRAAGPGAGRFGTAPARPLKAAPVEAEQMRPYWVHQDTLPAALLPPDLGKRSTTAHSPGKQVPMDDRCLKKRQKRDFPGGPVVRNPPSNGGDVGSVLGWGP